MPGTLVHGCWDDGREKERGEEGVREKSKRTMRKIKIGVTPPLGVKSVGDGGLAVFLIEGASALTALHMSGAGRLCGRGNSGFLC